MTQAPQFRRSMRVASEASSDIETGRISPSLLRAPPPRLGATRTKRGRTHMPSPPGSPTILGPAEAPMLPDEDDDEWEEDNAFVAAVAPTRVAKAAATSPSLRERRPNVTKSEEDDSAPAASSSSATLSPSLFEGVPKSEPLPPGTRLVRVKDAVIQFTRSPYQRASRAARPNEPSSTACAARKRLATQAELELKREGRTRVVMDNHVRQRASGAGGKGPSVHAQSDELQPRMNHIAQLKAKNIETGNQTPSWLLCGKTADQCYDQLAESALRANAVNSGIVKRKDTQGANYQTTRINCKGMGQAAATQCVNAALAMAMAEATLRWNGVKVRNPLATNAIDPCLFAGVFDNQCGDELVGVVSTTQLVHNANPTKLGHDCILSAAKRLARLELTQEAISERMASANNMLTAMCRSVGGGFEIDAAWAAIVLVVYLCSDPRGRPLLREYTALTDLDIQTACAFEAYGRGEVTRRARLTQERETADKEAGTIGKRSRVEARQDRQVEIDEATGIVIEDDTSSIVNDAEEMVDALDALDALAEDSARQDKKALATKRKRASKGNASASTADAHGILTWWFKALRCKDKSVLGTLVSYTKSAAREAAQATLETQAEGTSIAESRVISQMSADNALKSSAALHPFINRRPDDTPEWVSVSVLDGHREREGGPWVPGVALGLARVPNAARSSSLHACARPDRSMQPPAAAGTHVLHSIAVQEFCPRSDQAKTVPGVLERYRKVSLLRTDSGVVPAHQKARLTAVERSRVSKLEGYIGAECEPALPSAAAGVTRSFIALGTTMTIHEQTFAAATTLVQQGMRLHAQAVTMRAETRETELLTAQLMARGVRPTVQPEPYCLPAARLAVGLRINALLCRMMQGRSRKNEPCKVLLGVHTGAEASRETSLVSDMEPLPLATITDFDVRFAPRDWARRDPLAARVEAGKAKMALHVCVDHAVRVPEALSRLDNVFQARAMLYTAASQASRIGDLGASISAAAANANIAGSKKINVRRDSNLYSSNTLTSLSLISPRWQCADVNTLPALSAFNAYVGNITNVQHSFAGSPYSGAYGPSLDSGITCSGLLGHYVRSDNRGHGTMTLSQECADECAAVFGREHHVPIGKKKYGTRPIGTRGVPHGFVPGVHAVCDDLVAALGSHSNHACPGEAAGTVQGVFVLPFSGATQALAPDVESTADSTLRHCFRTPEHASCAHGRSYLPDATCEDEAIFTEPLWRRPCQASVGDNPWATSYEYADSVWNVMNTLALIAERLSGGGGGGGGGGVSALRTAITAFHVAPTEPNGVSYGVSYSSHLWALDACILIFGALYPHDHRINKPVVPECYARAHAELHRRAKADPDQGQGDGAPLWQLLSGDGGDALWAEARTLWDRFTTRPAPLCPWCVGVAPMLELILSHHGSYALSREDVAEHRKRVDTLASRAAWLAYSEDGLHPPSAPNPASSCATSNSVRRPTLDPVFVAQGEGLEIEPRGCLVGLKPFQLRQLLAMLLGSHLVSREAEAAGHPGVQVFRNEGGLELRVSSRPTVLEQDGTKRSPKAIAPTQTESDQAAYGTRKAKCYGADKQAKAWDANVRVLMPLCVRLCEPMPKEWRDAGEFGDPSWVRERIAQERDRLVHIVHPNERWARQQLESAANSTLSYQANSIDGRDGR